MLIPKMKAMDHALVWWIILTLLGGLVHLAGY